MQHISRLRNRDFIRQCQKSEKLLSKRGYRPSLNEIVAHALEQQAPSYYVDYYRANAMLKKINSSASSPHARAAIRRQWTDMAADLAAIHKKRPNAPLRDIVLELCTGRAGRPRFYLTRRRALEIAAIALKSSSGEQLK